MHASLRVCLAGVAGTVVIVVLGFGFGWWPPAEAVHQLFLGGRIGRCLNACRVFEHLCVWERLPSRPVDLETRWTAAATRL